MKKTIGCMIVCMGIALSTFAESKTEYSPGIIVGHGKNGFAWGQWNQSIKEAPVKMVRIRMQRVKGSEKSYVNLRFGRNGQALDGGKRVYLKGDKPVEVTWNVGGTSPGNQPLILNAYDGEVKVNKVVVTYQ